MSDNLSTTDRAWIELNMSNLENNINEFKSIIPKTTEIMAVVKANAYGHAPPVFVSRRKYSSLSTSLDVKTW